MGRRIGWYEAFILFLTLVCLLFVLMTSCIRPSVATSVGRADLGILESVKGLDPGDRLLVWIDINATGDGVTGYGLPTDPAIYGVERKLITFSPDIGSSNLLWCLAEIHVKDMERLLGLTWIHSITIVKPGGLEDHGMSSKLSTGFEETVGRARQRNGALQVIVSLEDEPCSASESTGKTGVNREIAENVMSTITHAGGVLLKDYHEQCGYLVAAMPAGSIKRVAENSCIQKLSLDGPIVPAISPNGQYPDTLAEPRGGGDLGLDTTIVLAASGILLLPRRRMARRRAMMFLFAVIVFLSTMPSFAPPAFALNVSRSAICVPPVWATGNKGSGVNVAIIDTGIDLSHPDFTNAVIDQIDVGENSSNVQDTKGHGTWVAGVVAGRGVNNSTLTGVAPEAGLVVVKVDYTSELAYAARWVIDRNARVPVQERVSIIQVSMGDGDSEGNPILGGDGFESVYSRILDDAVESGIVVVVAAGNSGNGSKTIVCPGNAFNVITVGAINDNYTECINDDLLCSFSSRGPTGDDRPKPDVVAPGAHIISCRAAGTCMERKDPADVYLTDYYIEDSGTSAAAPHVAGTIALMLHARPNLTPAQVKAILRDTARLNSHLETLGVCDRGHGIIDANAAVELAYNTAGIDKFQMFDAWNATTPTRTPGLWDSDYATFSIEAITFKVRNIQYHYRPAPGWPWGSADYKLVESLNAYVWINGNLVNLKDNPNLYMYSGPRIYWRGSGYDSVRAIYLFDGVRIVYDYTICVDYVFLNVTYCGSCQPKTLFCIDIDVYDGINYAYTTPSNETILVEKKITGISQDMRFNIRHENHTEYMQIEPVLTDNPEMWLLRSNYPGYAPSNPDSSLVKNDEYIYNRNIMVCYQAMFSSPHLWLHRKTDWLHAGVPFQSDADSAGDAGNTLGTAKQIDPGLLGSTYTGILCASDDEDNDDYYNVYLQTGQYIWADVSAPSPTDFDLEVYYPNGVLKVGSYFPAGYTDNVGPVADYSGLWKIRIFRTGVGEGQYLFHARVGWPGGCPYLHVYNGSEYVCEGLLDIHNDEGIDTVTDHTLCTAPARIGWTYQLRLTEHPMTRSHIDQVKLYAVLADKTVVNLPLVWAWHSEDGFVLPQLLFSDDWRTITLGADHNNGTSQSINLKFLALPPSTEVLNFMFQIEGYNPDEKE